ncbi:hypothetical protein KFU94_56705 [Chloroflexi bacterium TSY]|nr:hypothetical protein [Chloroflexi bacterium TSY]
MAIEFGLTNEISNTQYAPLAALLAHYHQEKVLTALKKIEIPVKTYEYTPASKLEQVLVSILCGCATLTEFNTKVRPERLLAKIYGMEQLSEQSNMSRTLDALTLMNIGRVVSEICKPLSQIHNHDWRGFLWLDFDLSGLPCGKKAQKSQKGYFSGKKTQRDANWSV